MAAAEETIARLRLICGETYVLSTAAETAIYGDGDTQPTVVVVPGTVNEVVAAVKACAATGLSCTPRGAGGPIPAHHSPVVIAMTRLRRVIAVDLEAGQVVAESGVPVAAVRRMIPGPLSVLPDLTTPGVATVGGALASGFGRRTLNQLELVSDQGELTQLNREAAGYDVAGAFVGSAGRWGIATRARLRLAHV